MPRCECALSTPREIASFLTLQRSSLINTLLVFEPLAQASRAIIELGESLAGEIGPTENWPHSRVLMTF